MPGTPAVETTSSPVDVMAGIHAPFALSLVQIPTSVLSKVRHETDGGDGSRVGDGWIDLADPWLGTTDVATGVDTLGLGTIDGDKDPPQAAASARVNAAAAASRDLTRQCPGKDRSGP
ncbi:MAG TPA: hypothetical protein VFI34_05435, partial [Candidatus Limnocylindrales bacterium]|nr:hypothetical protein [Candidatus Limnocylindrales bacterium]